MELLTDCPSKCLSDFWRLQYTQEITAARVPDHRSNARIVSSVWRKRMEVGLQHTDPLKTFLNTTYTHTCPGSGIDKIPFTAGRRSQFYIQEAECGEFRSTLGVVLINVEAT